MIFINVIHFLEDYNMTFSTNYVYYCPNNKFMFLELVHDFDKGNICSHVKTYSILFVLSCLVIKPHPKKTIKIHNFLYFTRNTRSYPGVS